MKRIVALLFALSFALSAYAAVTATVSNTDISYGSTLRLVLQRDGSGNDPDLNPLRKDFNILGSGSGTSVEIINGHIASKSQVTVLLSPKRRGKLQIPALQWGNEQTTPIELNMGASDAKTEAKGKANAADVFLTAEPDQTQPYVQAAVVLTVRLHADQPLYQATLDFPANRDVIVKQLGKDNATNEMRNGKNYQVIERKYLLFAQRSGRITLEGPELDAEIADGSDPFDNMFKSLGAMMSQTRPLHLQANPITLDVLPRPAEFSPWLPAQKVTLKETWGQEKVHAGEPIARHLTISAWGLTGEQLPDPSALLRLPDGIKAYPDSSGIADHIEGNTVLGSRDQNIALIAAHAGRYVLPEVKLAWWDTEHRVRREAVLPEVKLDILPAINGIVSHEAPPAAKLKLPNLPEENRPVSTWEWSSLGLALLLLAALFAWRFLKRRVTPAIQAKDRKVISAGSAFNAFQQACRANDPDAARRHLLVWASAVWVDDPPRGLTAFSHRLKDENVTEALRQLDRACYTGQEWEGEGLARLIPEKPIQEKTAGSAPLLPDLYA
jgi:hypothetical protein